MQSLIALALLAGGVQAEIGQGISSLHFDELAVMAQPTLSQQPVETLASLPSEQHPNVELPYAAAAVGPLELPTDAHPSMARYNGDSSAVHGLNSFLQILPVSTKFSI